MIGSMGKTVWSGLRLGWIRAGRRHLDRIVAARPAVDLGMPILEELIGIEALGDFEAILAERRAQLRESRDTLVELLAERMPALRVPRVDGGLVLWTSLGAPVSSALALAARSHGLQISAGPLFGTEGAFERFIRIPFTAPAHLLGPAVDALAEAWGSVGRYEEPTGPEFLQIA